ncbi:MAG: acyl-CoA mutase large subunit family protein [Acidobacteria bacterium]|nr:acyl-CoA mutase large subunit family protein [Acidobacteriota bacterium]
MEKIMSDNRLKASSADRPDPLLDEFPAPGAEEWRAAAEAMLKGAPWEKVMITRTHDGLSLQPMYRRTDVTALPFQDTLPGEWPYLRGTRHPDRQARGWVVAQEINVPTPARLNVALRHDLAQGQTAVNLQLDEASRLGVDPDQADPHQVGRHGTSIASLADLMTALEGIPLEKTPVFVDAYSTAPAVTAMLAALCRARNQTLDVLQGNVGLDPLGELAAAGQLPLSLSRAFDEAAELIRWARRYAPQLEIITIHGYPWHNAGASAVQELGFVLAAAVETVRALLQRGLGIDEIAPRLRFALAVGAQFFPEVAKLRAARLLWAKVVTAFGGSAAAARARIHARTSTWNQTVFDPYVNMLRATTETFSGVVGGCDSLHVSPFDEPVRGADEFARRIARNVQLVLREETHADQVTDPAGGSWFVECLTEAMAAEAWALFQRVEAAGGLTEALEAGEPQRLVGETAAVRRQKIDTRQDVIIGTNMYANPDEKPLPGDGTDWNRIHAERIREMAERRPKLTLSLDDDDPVEALIDACAHGATLGQMFQVLRAEDGESIRVTPLPAERGAAGFERLRQGVAAHVRRTGRAVRVFLANMGPPAQHKARADFSTGFCQVAGFTVVSSPGFATPDEAADAAAGSGADIVVVCSTDDTYPELVPAFVRRLRERRAETIVVLAGYPKDQVAAHQAAGVDEFIHLRADALATLRRLAIRAGVTGI